MFNPKEIRYILKHESLLKTIIEGDSEGYIGRGIPMMEYMTMKDINKEKYMDLNELSYNREAWKPATN